jgi:ABC-2 type transport system ATP-binding protein
MFDEPVNGLDPEGIRWVRDLLKQLAAEGRTVFVSSHLMSEMAQTAEHLIVIGRGRLLADMAVEQFLRSASKRSVRVRSPQLGRLTELIAGPEVTIERLEDSTAEMRGLDAEKIGEIAAGHKIVLYELTPQEASLEEAFMELTREEVEFQADSSLIATEREGALT